MPVSTQEAVRRTLPSRRQSTLRARGGGNAQLSGIREELEEEAAEAAASSSQQQLVQDESQQLMFEPDMSMALSGHWQPAQDEVPPLPGGPPRGG